MEDDVCVCKTVIRSLRTTILSVCRGDVGQDMASPAAHPPALHINFYNLTADGTGGVPRADRIG